MGLGVFYLNPSAFVFLNIVAGKTLQSIAMIQELHNTGVRSPFRASRCHGVIIVLLRSDRSCSFARSGCCPVVCGAELGEGDSQIRTWFGCGVCARLSMVSCIS